MSQMAKQEAFPSSDGDREWFRLTAQYATEAARGNATFEDLLGAHLATGNPKATRYFEVTMLVAIHELRKNVRDALDDKRWQRPAFSDETWTALETGLAALSIALPEPAVHRLRWMVQNTEPRSEEAPALLLAVLDVTTHIQTRILSATDNLQARLASLELDLDSTFPFYHDPDTSDAANPAS